MKYMGQQWLVAGLMGLLVACGGSGGTNDAGGAPLSAESVYVLSCKIDTLVRDAGFQLDEVSSLDVFGYSDRCFLCAAAGSQCQS